MIIIITLTTALLRSVKKLEVDQKCVKYIIYRTCVFYIGFCSKNYLFIFIYTLCKASVQSCLEKKRNKLTAKITSHLEKQRTHWLYLYNNVKHLLLLI